MPGIKLFVAPNTCARVPTIALEEIGIPFETELVRLGQKQQKTAEYLAVNPKGKVPAMLIDGAPLTENVAILSWLHQTYPRAALLPATNDRLQAMKQTADLAFFSGTVHPLVTRIAMPMNFIADAETAFELVRPAGTQAMMPVMALIENRLENGPWWYGDDWSIIDGYLFWVWARITGVGFPQDHFPRIRAHAENIQKRPSVQRAMQRELVCVDQLKSEGNYRAPR